MDMLKKYFPISFACKPKDTNALVISIVKYVAIMLAYSVVSAIVGFLLGALLSWLLGLLGTLVGLYGVGGIILSVLCYCDMLK